MITTYDKEKAKISFFELAPSLQNIINEKGANNDLMTITRLTEIIYGNNNDMRITCGLQLPANNPNVNMGVHLDSINMSMEMYGDHWFYHRLVYSD